MDIEESLQATDNATTTAGEVDEALDLAGKAQVVAVKLEHAEYQASNARLSFMHLPPEIRIQIYEYLLVTPHQGYIKCEITIPRRKESFVHAFSCHANLDILGVNKHVRAEASSIFYGMNTFGISERPGFGIRNGQIDASRVTKWHIFTRHCKWAIPRSTICSPNIYRQTGKACIIALSEVFSKPHETRYLLIDCLSGFGASTQMVMNDFRPLQTVTEIQQVHIVSTDKDHLTYLRYLEQSMMNQNDGFVGMRKAYARWLFFRSKQEKSESSEVGNALASVLRVKPCYPGETPTPCYF